LIDWYFGAPRRAFGLICLACVLMLAFGLYLQHVVGLEPCPMCSGVLALLAAFGGAYTAASQSWLQWYPPEVVTCGRDLYGMIETFPLKRALPMIFRGGGDCSKVDWSLFGLTLANWSFVAFVVLSLLLITLLVRSRRTR
jgi:disulfide bond formation protein DsbB